MDDDRLIEIETKLAHQDHLLEQLNDALSDQQTQLLEVKALCMELAERIQSIADQGSASSSRHERPPHY